MLIDEECGNFRVVVNGGELTRNIKLKNKPDVLQVYGCSLCDTFYRWECVFNKLVEYCESLR